MAAYDFAALWDAHCRYEFETRDVDATMSTMVAEPYVNHVPTMTGGVGFEKLRHFYAHHFIGVNPPDFELVPVSRTVGESSLVDEFIVRFTHTTRMDWMLPASNPPGAEWRFLRWPSCNFRVTNSCMSTSTGIKPVCSFNWVFSIPTAFPSPAPKPPARCSTFPCLATTTRRVCHSRRMLVKRSVLILTCSATLRRCV